MADFILRLSDANTTIGFVGQETAGYELLDGSLEISDPEIRQSGSASMSSDKPGISKIAYGNRTIRFAYRVRGTSLTNVLGKISDVNRLIEQARSPLFLSGGSFDGQARLASDYDVGTMGVRLSIAVGTNTIDFPEIETYEAVSVRDLYSFNVLYGQQRIVTPFSAGGVYVQGTEYFIREVEVTLTCESHALGISRVMGKYQDADGFMGVPPSLTATDRTNRMIIDGADIPGDAPAPTRIVTKLTGATSIIIARDAGQSLLNAATVPVRSGTGATGHLFVSGMMETNVLENYFVRIDELGVGGAPDRARVYRRNGVVEKAPFDTKALTPIQVDLDSGDTIYLMFTQATGHALNQRWDFYSSQSYFYPNTTKNVYSSYAGFMSSSGVNLGNIKVNIPMGVRKKYKVMANLAETSYKRTEYRMSVSFGFIQYGIEAQTWTEEAYSDWVMSPSHITTTLDLGLLDLTASGCPALQNPSSIATAQISVYARGVDALTTTHNVVLSHMFLVPASDPNAYIRASWTHDAADGWEVYCNYNEAQPYIMETTGSYWQTALDGFTDITADIADAVPLDVTWIGKHITLIPGVTNTIYFLPIFNSEGDYRKGFVTTSETGPTYVACRPKYLFVG